MSENDFSIENNPAESRFEIHVDGVRAGIADYEDADGVRTFPHTVVEKEFGGRGLAGHLVRRALDETRGEGLKVRPACSFVEKFIERNPEYSDLLA